jgi:monoamine oxidase
MSQIAIVGAGVAGLSAALTLQDAGLACSIYEASNPSAALEIVREEPGHT